MTYKTLQTLKAYIPAAAGHLNAVTIKPLFDLNSVVTIIARVPQIFQNFRTGSTGQLSIVTCGISLGGVCIRVFTSSQEGSPALVRQYLICECWYGSTSCSHV